MNMLEGFRESIRIETPSGLDRVEVRVKSVEKKEECWVVKLGLSSRGRWFWGETFIVLLEGGESKVRISVTRIGGVGRIHADVLGLWIIESLKERCNGTFPVVVERF